MRQAGIWRKLAAVFTRREQGRGTLILYVCPHSVFEKNNSHPLARIRKLLYTTRDASVAQWIEQWPPEPRAEVRFLSDAFFYYPFSVFPLTNPPPSLILITYISIYLLLSVNL